MTGFWLSLLFILSLEMSAQAETKNKLEELFIWKVSDELKLSIPEEKKFTTLLRGLSAKKEKLNADIQGNLQQLGEDKTSKEKEKHLTEQKRLLRAYNELSLDEAEQIQKILGVDRAARYFIIKNELTNKLKLMLSPAENQPTEKLAPPKILEDKDDK